MADIAARRSAAQLVYVHGIGRPLDPGPAAIDAMAAEWSRALAAGMEIAGHSGVAKRLRRSDVRVSMAYYGDLFRSGVSQGRTDDMIPAGVDPELLEALADDLIRLLAEQPLDSGDSALVSHAAAQLHPAGARQGFGNVLRRTSNALTTILQLRLWSRLGQWSGDRLMVSHLGQVARYLQRGEPDDAGRTIDQRIRARLGAALGPGPTVVLAHSLGSVVAWETLHEYAAPVSLFVTFGSPLGMRTSVLPRLRPRPPATPDPVLSWLNFWDKDDVVVARHELADDFRPNRQLVRADSRRVESDGVRVHTALKYLAQAGVAGPVAESLVAAGA